MSDEKICPIMSRPKDEDVVEDEHDLETCKSVGFIIIGKVPWSAIFPCQRERCMAWVPECEEVGRNSCCQTIEDCFKEKSQPQRDNCFGYCKLIERQL